MGSRQKVSWISPKNIMLSINHIVRALRELTVEIIIVSKVTSRLVSTRSKNNLVWTSFPFIFAAAIYLFYPSLNYYFFQDDWFVLNWVQNSDWLSLFNFRQDIIYWRPLSMPIFFKIGQSLFGLNPVWYHLVVFIIHLFNSFLIFHLMRQLKFHTKTSFLVAFFYATAAFHFIPLSWLSTTSYVLGPTFIFSSILMFLRQKSIISFALFILGLASSEFTLTLIPIILLISGFKKLIIKNLLPHLLVGFIYLLFRLLMASSPLEGQYAPQLIPKVITNIFWYFAWIFNAPETLSTVFYLTRPQESLIAVSRFWPYLILPLVLMAIFFSLIKFGKVSLKQIAQGLAIFSVGLSPIIFLPHHVYPMYLVVASLGIFLIFAHSLEQLIIKYPLFIWLLALLWFIASFTTLSFTRTNHWLVNLESISKSYISYTQNQVASPPPESFFMFRFPEIKYSQSRGFVIVQDEQNIKQALNDQDALQVIYRDKSLVSLYETRDYIPQAPANTQTFTIQPK